VVDLAWFNEAAVHAVTFSGLEIDWEGSLGSDHEIHVTVQTRVDTPISPVTTELCFLLDPDKRDKWSKALKARSTAAQVLRYGGSRLNARALLTLGEYKSRLENKWRRELVTTTRAVDELQNSRDILENTEELQVGGDHSNNDDYNQRVESIYT